MQNLHTQVRNRELELTGDQKLVEEVGAAGVATNLENGGLGAAMSTLAPNMHKLGLNAVNKQKPRLETSTAKVCYAK